MVGRWWLRLRLGYASDSERNSKTKVKEGKKDKVGVKTKKTKKKKEPFNLLRKFGNLSPWYSISPYGDLQNTSSHIPPGCEIKELHVLHRHGARYPTNYSESLSPSPTPSCSSLPVPFLPPPSYSPFLLESSRSSFVRSLTLPRSQAHTEAHPISLKNYTLRTKEGSGKLGMERLVWGF